MIQLRPMHILRVAAILLGAGCAVAETEAQPSAPSSLPDNLKVIGDMLYFAADDGVHGRELWGVGPGDGHTVRMLADVEEGALSSNPRVFQDAGGRLAFVAMRFVEGLEPWVYDPEQNQVFLVENIGPGRTSSDPCLGRMGNGVFFLASRSPDRLWAMNPHSLELTLLRNTGQLGEFPCGVLANGGFLCGATRLLYASNGTPEGTSLLFEAGAAWIQWITAIGDRAVFSASDADHGNEIFLTDGTPQGTGLLKDICPGPAGAGIAQMFGANTIAFFQADDGIHGSELWVTDGTADGTRLVKDINPGRPGSDPHYFAQGAGGVYFAANDGMAGKELWYSDGSGEGTVRVTNLSPGQAGAVWSLMNAGNRLYFCANSDAHGEEVFYTEGKPGDATLLSDIVPGPDGSGPANLTLFNDRIYFTCDDGLHGEELWLSDGTKEGTRLAMDIRMTVPTHAPSSMPQELTPLGTHLLFSADDLEHGRELWISDGKPGGTRIIEDIAPGTADSLPQNLTVQGTRTFFTAETASYGRELWVTDGTAENTGMVCDLISGAVGSNPFRLTTARNGVYFLAEEAAGTNRLYCTDGTTSGTSPVLLPEGSHLQASPLEVMACQDEVFVHAIGASERSLYRAVDLHQPLELLAVVRTAPTTRDLAASGDTEWLVGPPLKEKAEMALLLFSGERRTNATMPVTMGEQILFPAYSPGFGTELWKAEAGSAERQLAADLFPGQPSSGPAFLTPLGPMLFFIAEHPEQGRILWQTDGTSGGTFVANLHRTDSTRWPAIPAFEMAALNGQEALLTIRPPYLGGPADRELAVLSTKDQFPQLCICNIKSGGGIRKLHQLVQCGSRVYFACDDGVHGEELWVSDGTVDGTYLVRDIL